MRLAARFLKPNNMKDHEIKITIKDMKCEIESNILHDDLVMYYLIEAIFQLRNKQYADFFEQDDKTKQHDNN